MSKLGQCIKYNIKFGFARPGGVGIIKIYIVVRFINEGFYRPTAGFSGGHPDI